MLGGMLFDAFLCRKYLHLTRLSGLSRSLLDNPEPLVLGKDPNMHLCSQRLSSCSHRTLERDRMIPLAKWSQAGPGVHLTFPREYILSVETLALPTRSSLSYSQKLPEPSQWDTHLTQASPSGDESSGEQDTGATTLRLNDNPGWPLPLLCTGKWEELASTARLRQDAGRGQGRAPRPVSMGSGLGARGILAPGDTEAYVAPGSGSPSHP